MKRRYAKQPVCVLQVRLIITPLYSLPLHSLLTAMWLELQCKCLHSHDGTIVEKGIRG